MLVAASPCYEWRRLLPPPFMHRAAESCIVSNLCEAVSDDVDELRMPPLCDDDDDQSGFSDVALPVDVA